MATKLHERTSMADQLTASSLTRRQEKKPASKLTDTEAHLAAELLDLASDTFANNGCTEINLTDFGLKKGESAKLRLDMERWNGDDIELRRLEGLDEEGEIQPITQDFYLMSYLAYRLRQR